MKINGVEIDHKVADGKMSLIVRCDCCKGERSIDIPDETITFMRDCGASDDLIARNYKEYRLDNCYYYCFFKAKCDLCGEKRVLGWEAGNSPASHEIISPSEELRFWPNYDYPVHKIRICKWCMPDNNDEKSRKQFMIKLFDAMLKEEKDNWKWKNENKR